MAISGGAGKLPIGAVVAAVGGVVAAVGAFLAWETIDAKAAASIGESASISGWESGSAGKIVTIMAIIAVALAVVWIMGIKLPIPPMKAFGFVTTSTEGLVVLAGVLCLLSGLWGFLGVSKDVNDANALIPGFGGIGMGLFVSIAGGAVAAVGGALGVMARKGE